ncbi:MAG: ATP-binding protein [Flavobacteriales bacterium]|nr:ATP-binding protein [Flavobacteriales bacterium]
MISRILVDRLRQKMFKQKAIIVLGPRQVGKTTLLKNLAFDPEEILWMNADEIDVQQTLSEVSSGSFKALLGKKKIFIIDEAQRIENIGLKLKLITDNLPEIQVIATGSSSFDLANRVNEPLTGRKWEYNLFPLSYQELVAHHGMLAENRLLEHRLVYGYYPEVVSNPGEEEERLKLICHSYLYKDVLLWERLHKSDKLVRLLQALAHQIGSQVSFNELAEICSMDPKTVEKYVNLLEQAFVIFRLPSFSRNLRNELKSSRKIYFFDNGIRNAIINNFNPIALRSDVGFLWENFLVSERLKFNSYHLLNKNSFFWRTVNQQEIDLIEEYGGQLHAYEFKWNSKKTVRLTRTFQNAYPDSTFDVITPNNLHEFLLPKK